jgi:hypothetical protein
VNGLRLAVAAGVLAVLATIPGCLGYRLGTTLPPGIRSVAVPAFVNQTGEPDLEAVATQAAVREFQKDGTLRVAGRDEADAVVEVRLLRFNLEPLRYRRDQAKTSEEYRIWIKAHLFFARRDTGEVLLERQIVGRAEFEPAGDLSSAKLDAIPDAAEDLAHEIVESVVEYW